MSTRELIDRYYDAFNAGDVEAMVACLSDDVRHETNQGPVRHGAAAFRDYLAHMRLCYAEQVEDIRVMIDESGAFAAASFVVRGKYVMSSPGLPPARGQDYVMPAGTFFEVENGRISRVATCYNLADWIAQVA